MSPLIALAALLSTAASAAEGTLVIMEPLSGQCTVRPPKDHNPLNGNGVRGDDLLSFAKTSPIATAMVQRYLGSALPPDQVITGQGFTGLAGQIEKWGSCDDMRQLALALNSVVFRSGTAPSGPVPAQPAPAAPGTPQPAAPSSGSPLAMSCTSPRYRYEFVKGDEGYKMIFSVFDGISERDGVIYRAVGAEGVDFQRTVDPACKIMILQTHDVDHNLMRVCFSGFHSGQPEASITMNLDGKPLNGPDQHLLCRADENFVDAVNHSVNQKLVAPPATPLDDGRFAPRRRGAAAGLQ